MSEVHKYPKRLIEVDLPIKLISTHARYENSLRHGRLSNLHLWWARRPTVACRSVILAAVLPDPVDPNCPERFRTEAAAAMRALRAVRGGGSSDLTTPSGLRQALLAFVGEMSAWTIPLADEMWRTARTLVGLSHEALGEPGTRPLCADPFAGGGSIPAEALRLGMDVVASDSNQVAVLLNRAALELLPKHGPEIEEAVRTWGEWVLAGARERLSRLYPADANGATPIAYLWARTIRCEGPGCGAEIPLLRSFCIAKKKSRSVYLKLVPRSNPARVDFEIDVTGRPETGPQGTIRSGSVTCPIPGCGFTTRLKDVRQQIKARQGATQDARLICVVTVHPRVEGRSYRLPTALDLETVAVASEMLRQRRDGPPDVGPSFVPDEPISTNELRRIAPPLYGMSSWGHLFSARQAFALGAFCELIHQARNECATQHGTEFADAVQVFLALTLSRLVDLSSSLTRWKADAECPVQLISRQAIPFVWDFAEPSLIAESSGSWASAVERTAHVLRSIHASAASTATVVHASAQQHPLPTGSVNALITDPPYYDSVPYAHLSDFFYVWLKRALPASYRDTFAAPATEKEHEIVVDRPHSLSTSRKDVAFYEKSLRAAFEEGLRILAPGGIGVVVFASKSTASWEAILRALIDAGWVISGSWPIDTEMETRVSAQGQARLASSIHLVCRPRSAHGSSRVFQDVTGDWREVLAELPVKMHDWLPRLEREGIVGADAIFSCLGPALEIFSRYSRVEKVSGEPVELREYLEHVWAAVSREALATVFRDADTLGLEEDARLSAMWLWTLAGHSESPSSNAGGTDNEADQVLPDDESDSEGSEAATTGFTLEYDAARKIAQGVGARLDALVHLVEVRADKARLLPVLERTRYLFGRAEDAPSARKAAKKKQMSLFGELAEAAEAQGWGEVGAPKAGTTTLDRVHQAMLLFGAGRGEALKRFIVEEGIGKQPQFWKLAQSLSALYPNGTDEKRWVDGVLARKKGLGF